jgi:hypothetical protein
MQRDPRGGLVCDRGLPAARREFDRWRRSVGRVRRIPQDLWERASALAREHGVSRTARALGLDYDALARRMQTGERRRKDDRRISEASAFVELSIPAVETRQARAPTCRLELSAGGSTRLCLELDGVEPVEIDALARGLWGAAR